VWIQGPAGASPLRQLRNLARFLPSVARESAQAIIILTPSTDVPPELTNHATVLELPLPDREEIAGILDAAIDALPEFENDNNGNPDPTKPLRANAAPNGTRNAAIDAAVGLSGEEAAACYARSLVQLRKIDPKTVAGEKRRIIARERVLEWYDPIPGGLDAVGGLENLKEWLLARSAAYSPKAREYGLPAPKGALLAGVPGCGKSLIAKAIATAWGVPLLRLDLGALKSKFVGDSEGNLRKALSVIEAIGRCVVWLDEIEKALQGATSGSADGGVSADALGTILSWMQERQGEAFVIATANDVSGLPPELLRKGRFDEIWWVDLPTPEERLAIIQAALKSHGRDPKKVGALTSVAEQCEEFTGSEIAAIVPDALFTAFNDGAREITTDDLLSVAKKVVPLSKTAAEKIKRLRDWANDRARPASKPYVEQRKKVRALDI
jgi:ATPase family associated with various cellular activities (AAA)